MPATGARFSVRRGRRARGAPDVDDVGAGHGHVVGVLGDDRDPQRHRGRRDPGVVDWPPEMLRPQRDPKIGPRLGYVVVDRDRLEAEGERQRR